MKDAVPNILHRRRDAAVACLAACGRACETRSSERGLSSAEAEDRLRRYGPNRPRPPKRRSALVSFLLQFHNVLIYVLLASAAVTAAMQHWVDTAVILGVVIINALIGFLQEGKAERALDAIRNMLSLNASVLRDGHRQAVAADRSCRATSSGWSPATRCPRTFA